MPKRRNPFGDGSPLQFKTHVGKKELNAGISGEQNLKSVYERTKQLLFSGAQNLYTSPVTADDNCNLPFIPNNNPPEAVTHAPGQLVLDHQGQLTVPSALGLTCSEEMETNQGTNSFGITNIESQSYSWNFLKGKKPAERRRLPSDERCNFCDKALVKDGSLQCSLCQKNFCPLCSLTNYDESIERTFCLTCAS